MADFINIVGMGEAEVSASGDAVRFLLETRDGHTLHLSCTTEGLAVLIACLTAVNQKAFAKRMKGPSDEKQLDVVPVQQVACGPSENSLDVIVSVALASGIGLNLALSPELARNLAERLAADASKQLRKRN